MPAEGRWTLMVPHVLALTEHGGPVTAMVAHGNVAGTQFHPEKSQKWGLRLLENFAAFVRDRRR